MANQQPKNQGASKPVKKKSLTKQDVKHNIEWFLNRLVSYPLFDGCTPTIKSYDDGSGGNLCINGNWNKTERFSERLANILRPDLSGMFQLWISTREKECSVSFSSLKHPVIQEIYKWIKYNEEELKITKIRGIHIGIGECEYNDDNQYIEGLRIYFEFDPNDPDTFEDREKCVNGALNSMMDIAEKRINEQNQRINIEFNDQNIPEVYSIIETWFKKKSFKRCKFEKNLKAGHTYYIASTGGEGKHNGDFTHRINKIVRGRHYRWAVSSLYFYFRGLIVFEMDYHENYREQARNIYHWLENNASEFGIDVVYPINYFSKEYQLRITFINITGQNYKERLETILNTIDTAIGMFK